MANAVKLHVKKGDTVLVLSGKDKGKQGKIVEALPKKAKVVVEGVNKVKRHTKPSQANPQGGIITRSSARFFQSNAGMPGLQTSYPY